LGDRKALEAGGGGLDLVFYLGGKRYWWMLRKESELSFTARGTMRLSENIGQKLLKVRGERLVTGNREKRGETIQ